MAFAVLIAEKHTPKIREKNSVEKFGENISFFGAFFGAFFGMFFCEQLFASKSQKFVQNLSARETPFKKLGGKQEKYKKTTTENTTTA